MADTDVKGEGSKIETVLSNGDKDYNEDKEFQRASKVVSNWIVHNIQFIFEIVLKNQQRWKKLMIKLFC